MSIKDRVDDAIVLLQHGRKPGALLATLVAVAATARKKYPHPQYGDAESFKKFVAENMLLLGGAGNVQLRFRGTMYRLEEILYKFVRCELAHVAEIPFDIQFTPAIGEGALHYDLSHGDVRISEDIIDRLVACVRGAPENAAEFTPLFQTGGLEIVDGAGTLPFRS